MINCSNAADWIPHWLPERAKRIALWVGVPTLAFWIGFSAGQRYQANEPARAAAERGYYTSDQLADIEDVSRRTITAWASDGRIDGAYKQGREWRFRRDYRITAEATEGPPLLPSVVGIGGSGDSANGGG